ncbi:MAG: hypothetical protein IJ379_13775, partial [Lachnospiraceae bacterium]|nr:hypothetical protein [Lachnospiraceae bacterium]
MKKVFWRKLIATIVMISLLPFDSFVGCFPVKVQVAEVVEAEQENDGAEDVVGTAVLGGDVESVSGSDVWGMETTISSGDVAVEEKGEVVEETETVESED